MLERLSLYNDVLLVASSPLQERITQQEFLFSTSVHSDKNKICIREKDCRRIKMCAGERLPYFNFLLSNNNRDWSVIFFSLPYRMTSSSPFNCETPNLILKVVNRQEKDFFQKLEHSLFSEIGLNSWFKKIWQFKQHVVHFHSYTMSGRLELDVLIDILQNSFDQTTLQTRVLQWDEKLPIPDPPPLRSLVEHLVRRRLPSCATSVENGLNNLFVHSACRVLGLRDAHKRYERARTS